MSRDMIRVGGIGAIFLMLAVIAGIVSIVMLWASGLDYLFAGRHIDFGSGIAWGVGLILLSVGAFGFWKQYNNKPMLTVCIIGIMVMAIGLVATIVNWWFYGAGVSGVSAIFWPFYQAFSASLLDWVGIAGIVWLVLNGVFLILFGSAMIKLKDSTGVAQMTNATGVIMLIAGITFIAIIPFGFLVSHILLLLATTFMIYVSFKAK